MIPATPITIRFANRDVVWTDNDRGDADVARIAHLVVIAGTFDEGPMSPAFYWSIENDAGDRIDSGWSRSVASARRDALRAARDLLARPVA